MQIGIIGLGLAGRALAKRLLTTGYDVCGYDIDETARNSARVIGVDVTPDAAAIAGETSLVILSLLTADDRRKLLWGSQALAGVLNPGTVILDCTTAPPNDTREDHARLDKQNVRLIDMCILGSSEEIEVGNCVALLGDRETNQDYERVVQAVSKRRFYFDKPGKGNEAKLIANLVLGLNRLVLAEGLGLAAKAGFDLDTILDMLKSGGSYSTVMDTKGHRMIAGAYDPPAARLAQHAKDVRLILNYAGSLNARVPVSELHAGILDRAIAAGWGEMDNGVVFETYSQ